MSIFKDPRRPLEINELTWILEQKIRGDLPVQQDQQQESTTTSKATRKKPTAEAKVTETVSVSPKKRGRKPKSSS